MGTVVAFLLYLGEMIAKLTPNNNCFWKEQIALAAFTPEQLILWILQPLCHLSFLVFLQL